MRSLKALAAALTGIDALASGEPLATVLAAAVRRDPMRPKEKRAAADAARGVARWLRTIDLAIAVTLPEKDLKRLTLSDRSMLRYGTLRVLIEKEPAGTPSVELGLLRCGRTFALGERVLSETLRRLPAVEALPIPDDPVRAVAQRTSFPDWLARALAADLGIDRAERYLVALNAPERWDLRVNHARISVDDLAARLTAVGVSVRKTRLAPYGLIADDRAGLFGSAFEDGLFELHDEASQLVAVACGAKPGDRVLDFCADGPKTLALASDVLPGGAVFACDVVPGRTRDLPERVRRARFSASVRPSSVEPEPSEAGAFDVVLVDVPCSGVGSLRREPDLRWRLKPAEIEALPAFQLATLRRAAKFVRPGGRLVYATSSPFARENTQVVEAFLTGESGMRRVPVGPQLPPKTEHLSEKGCLQTWPDRDDTGGCFAAVMYRLR